VLIIPSAVDPPARERSAGLVPRSTADGMIRLRLSQQDTVDTVLTIIPEPERPRRRPHTCDDYRVKVPVEASYERVRGP
jgi:hypothetical protein